MSERPDDLTPEACRARDAVRALSAPRPEPGYRARMKRGFVEGAFAEPAAPRPVALPGREPSAWGGMLLPMAAALLVVSALSLSRGPSWEVVRATGSGAAVVDGRAIPLARSEDLGRAIRHGARVVLPPGVSLVVAAAGQMAVEITAETEARLSAPPGRWVGRIARAEVETGEIRVTTGRDFHGARLRVRTPEARVDVTGTTLAVIREPHGTCVCVMYGVVRVGAKRGSMVPVEAGRRRFVFNDGRAPEQDTMRPIEHVKLAEMRDEYRERLGMGER